MRRITPQNSRLPMTAISRIVHRHLDLRGWNIITLARTLAPKNPTGSRNKLEALLSGQCVNWRVLDSVCSVLQIHQAECQAALDEDHLAWLKRIEDEQRSIFRPHICLGMAPHWCPSLLTVLGGVFFRSLPAGDELLAAEKHEQIITIMSSFVAKHSTGRQAARGQPIHYLYRRALDVAYQFDADGVFVQKITTPILAPMSGWIR